MCAIVQWSILHRKQENSSDKCYRNKLLGEGRTCCRGQKESWVALQYTVSEFQFSSVNYTVVAKIHMQKFRAKQTILVKTVEMKQATNRNKVINIVNKPY